MCAGRLSRISAAPFYGRGCDTHATDEEIDMRKPLVIAGVGLLAAGIGGGVAVGSARTHSDPARERNAEARYTAAHRSEATVSQAGAEQAALARHEGKISDTHLENEGHGLRWEVKSDDGSQVWEVQVDAHRGQVVSDQPDE